MWELDHEEGWAPKNWYSWTVVLEKTFESPSQDCKEIKLVNLKGNQPWIFIRRIHAQAEAPVLWPPDVKSWLVGKDLDAGEDWRQKEKGATEDEMSTDSMDMNWSKLQEMLEDRGAWHAAVHGVTKGRSRLSDWTELNTLKGFSIVNEAEVDVFLEFSCFLYELTDVGNLISGCSPFSKSSLNIYSSHSCTVEAWLGEFWVLLC